MNEISIRENALMTEGIIKKNCSTEFDFTYVNHVERLVKFKYWSLSVST